MIGRHSAIDNPEPVSRVTPPSTIIANTIPQQISNQVAMALLREVEVGGVFIAPLFLFYGERAMIAAACRSW
jgi:hypothetical protein